MNKGPVPIFIEMKRIIFFLIVVFVLLGAAALAVRPAICWFAQKKLGSVFTDAAVSVGDCRLDLFHRLSFLDIRVKRDKLYDVSVDEVNLDYNLSSLTKKNIDDFARIF